MLKDKVALVTGSTSGIGLGIAKALAKEGATLVINGLGDPLEIEKTRAALAAETGVVVHFIGADLSKTAAVEEMITKVEATCGRLDILVNNAGVPAGKIRPDHRLEPFRRLPRHPSGCVTGMKQRGWGRIINIAYAHALVASPFKSAYVASKHAVLLKFDTYAT